jgi:predicted dehydrogenase
MGVYGLTQITAILGPARKVTAFAGITEKERELAWGPRLGDKIKVEAVDNALVLLDFGSSLFAVVDGSYNMISAKGPGLEIYGRKGVINIYQPWLEPGAPLYQIYSLVNQNGPPRWESPEIETVTGALSRFYRMGRTALIEHLVDCIQQARHPLVSLEHAAHVLEIMLKAAQSAQEGRALELETTFPYSELLEDEK